MRSLIFLDESGDLGWCLDKPYQHGGSSRMLTLSAICLPEHKTKYIKRIVKALYQKRKRPLQHELKSVHLNRADKSLFLSLTTKLLQQHQDIHLYSITLNKNNIPTKINRNPNALYNYMVKKLVLDYICDTPFVDFIPDRRSEYLNIKWNMGEYLTQMIIERNIEQKVINQSCIITPMDSSKNLELQFIDFYTGLIWAMDEYQELVMRQFIHSNQIRHDYIELKHL